MTEEAGEVEHRRQRFKLSHPAVKLKLIREIALSGKTQRQLAEEYGVVESAMTAFKHRHAEAINDVRQNASDEFAGLWIAKKQNRIQAYMDQVDFLAQRVEDGTEDPEAAFKVAQSALKAVAEEMGQLTARVAVAGDVGARVTHELVGVNVEEV